MHETIQSVIIRVRSRMGASHWVLLMRQGVTIVSSQLSHQDILKVLFYMHYFRGYPYQILVSAFEIGGGG